MNLKLVTLDQARRQVNAEDGLHDRTLNDMREDASSLVLDYLKDTIDIDDTSFDWCDDYGEPVPGKVPPLIRRAVLIELGGYFENRDGDAWRSPTAVSPSVVNILGGLFKPALG